MDEQSERLLEHAWRHFSFHAQQRTTVFNFFTASAGLTLTGLFYVLATPAASRGFGIAAGVGAAILALIFWKLDQRVTQIIKEGEEVSILIEQSLPNPGHRIFERTDRLDVNASLNPFKSKWSYGNSFRLMFMAVGITGLIGAGAAIRPLLAGPTVPPVKRCALAVAGRPLMVPGSKIVDAKLAINPAGNAVAPSGRIYGHHPDDAAASSAKGQATCIRHNPT